MEKASTALIRETFPVGPLQCNCTLIGDPVSKKAIDMLAPEVLANLPNSPENAKNALFNDLEFWTDHGEELEQRFTAWAAR